MFWSNLAQRLKRQLQVRMVETLGSESSRRFSGQLGQIAQLLLPSMNNDCSFKAEISVHSWKKRLQRGTYKLYQ